jgi:hypothetical protein
MATLEATQEKEKRHQKFLAAIQGVDIDAKDKTTEEEPTTLQDVYARVNAKISGDPNLIDAAKAGITEDMGLGYEVIK